MRSSLPRPRRDADKRYDRAYFDRWYRDPRHAIARHGVLGRRVQLALAATEYLLERPVRTVLDVGCGEGRWREPLRRARPKLRYTGVDSSDYVVRRFGRRRDIRLGRFGDLGRLGLPGPFDLIVCSDVLHYVATPEARRGLQAIARLLDGVAMIELYTVEDQSVGDDQGFQPRGAATYRRLFREAGLLPLGFHCYVARRFEARLARLERGGWGLRRG